MPAKGKNLCVMLSASAPLHRRVPCEGLELSSFYLASEPLYFLFLEPETLPKPQSGLESSEELPASSYNNSHAHHYMCVPGGQATCVPSL